MASVPLYREALVLSAQQAVHIKMQAGRHYLIRKAASTTSPPPNPAGADNTLADNLIATRHGDALHVRYADGSSVVLDDFYGACTDASICSVTVAGEGDAGCTLSGQTSAGTVPADSGTLVYAHGQQDVLMGMAEGQAELSSALANLNQPGLLTYLPPGTDTLAGASWQGLVASSAAGLLAAGGGLGSGGASPNSDLVASVSTVMGDIQAGPVQSGNDLEVNLYAQDGFTLLASHVAVDSNGHFQARVGSYSGVVFAKLVNKGSAADYLDEANSANLLGASVDTPAEIQALVDAYNAILNGADGAVNANANISPTQYAISASELVINTTPPSITVNPVSDGYINAAEKTQDLTISGTTDAQVGQTVTVTFNGQNYTALVLAGATHTFSLTVPASALSALTDGSYNVGASVTNIFGTSNTVTPSVVLDTHAPTVTAVTDNVGASVTNGAVDFTVSFDEALVGTVSTANFTATNGSVTAVTALGGNQYQVSVSPTAGLASGSVALSLVGTGLTDAAGNTVANANLSGLDSQAVDTLAPTQTVSGVLFSADTGSSSTDRITSVASQTVTATLSAALAGGDVLYGSINGGSTWVDITSKVSGTAISWNGVTLSASGSVVFKLVDSVGNTSANTGSAAYVLDTAAPTTTLSAIALSADTAANGGSNTDYLTKTAAQTITATLSTGLVAGETLYGSLDAGGTWVDITNKVSGTTLTWTGATLSGSSSIQLKVTDTAGNDGATATQAYTLDTVAPTTTIATLALSADTAANGTSNTDFTTKTASQTISGTLSANLAAGETVYVSIDGGSTWTAATTTVGQAGWSIAQTLTGSGTLSVKVTDDAGNDGTVRSQAYDTDAAAYQWWI